MIIRSNNLGWKIDKVRWGNGFIIRRHTSLFTIVSNILPLVGGASALAYFVLFRGAILGPLLGLGLLLYLLCYGWNAQLFLNTKKRIVMGGGYWHRFKFAKAVSFVEQSGELYKLVVMDEVDAKSHVVWESTEEKEVLTVAEFLMGVLEEDHTGDGGAVQRPRN